MEDTHGRRGEIWRRGEMWRDVARCGEMRRDAARCAHLEELLLESFPPSRVVFQLPRERRLGRGNPVVHPLLRGDRHQACCLVGLLSDLREDTCRAGRRSA